ncbi:hypothetical protein B0A50_08400 [Salinomyces thailandicus]|uniref:Uncharacterized protein n=1 Tax=Salinomyces thailandicus TaxID=706561 RepID=A0A4U0TLD0_9PEZI|nr:hypothetical protein B0A50_08400 [Salinomyces thailandica]
MAVTLLFEEQHEAYELFTKTDLFNVMFEEERGSKISTETLTRAHARWNEEWCRGGRKEKEVEDEKGHKRHRDFRHMVELRIEDADMRIGMNGPQDNLPIVYGAGKEGDGPKYDQLKMLHNWHVVRCHDQKLQYAESSACIDTKSEAYKLGSPRLLDDGVTGKQLLPSRPIAVFDGNTKYFHETLPTEMFTPPVIFEKSDGSILIVRAVMCIPTTCQKCTDKKKSRRAAKTKAPEEEG